MVDEAFDSRNQQYISEMARDERLRELSLQWLLRGYRHEYSYHFTWLGLPVIQYPQDVMALQEIIWRVKPDAIVETGGIQCGYCTPGFVVMITALLRKHPRPDEELIRQALSGNICRCTGYSQIVDAVQQVIEANVSQTS